MVIEKEKSYLLKYLPKDLDISSGKEVIDLYIPVESEHPILRIRKKGENIEITKKYYPDPTRMEEAIEQTIPLTASEYKTLSGVESKRLSKMRFKYSYKGLTIVIDVFRDNLAGLVLAEIEYENESDLTGIELPDFFLAPVKGDDNFGGGKLAGKTILDLEQVLSRYSYISIDIKL